MFRTFLAGLAAVAWGVTAWLGSHRSSNAVIVGRWSKPYFAVVATGASVALLLTVAHAPPIYRRVHPARRKLLAALLSVVVSVLALEGLVRLLDPLGISYYAVAREYNADKVADPELVYRHPPGAHRTYAGIDYDYNDQGLRERPIGPKAEGECRVLFLGDSVVLGSAIRIEDAFVRLTEPMLSSRLGRPVRTINSGVGSYNTTQQLAFLARHFETIDPDFVLLVYVENDVDIAIPLAPMFRGRSPPEVVMRLLGHSWLYRLFAHVRHVGAQRRPVRDEPGWRRSMADLAAIAGRCRARGTPFAVLLWRYRPSEWTDALWEDLSLVAASNGFPLGDMLPAFEGADFRAVTISPVDSHPNAQGHRLAAARIEAFLAPLLLPAK